MSATDPLLPLFLLSDEPIDGAGVADNYFEPDPFAETVARAALGTKGPFTIGVYGDWGSGKTSVLHAARGLLDRDKTWKHVVTVDFNAWRFEREQHPLVALVATIERRVHERISDLEKTAGNVHATKIQWYKKAMTCCRAFLAGLQVKFKPELNIPLIGKVGAEINWSLKDSLERYAKLQDDIRDLDDKNWAALRDGCLSLSVFDALDRIGEGVGGAAGEGKGHWPLVVVFIDDLDRCRAERAFELLENVKLVLSQPGFVFVLALNEVVVRKYLDHLAEQRYGKDHAAIHRSYLDKIVQLPLHMPKRRERFRSFAETLLDRRLARVDSGFRTELKRLADVLSLSANHTPRSLVRRINTVLVDIALRDPATLPDSLKREAPPYPHFSGLCIVQRAIEAAIGKELTDTLAADDLLCEVIRKENIWGVPKAIEAARGADSGRGGSSAAAEPLSVLGWQGLFDALYAVQFLWYEDGWREGQPFKGAALLTSNYGQRWLAKHDERRGVMQFTAARPEEMPAPSTTAQPTATAEAGEPARTAAGSPDQIARQRTIIERAIREKLKLPADAPLTPAILGGVTELSFSFRLLTDHGASILADPETKLNNLTNLTLAFAQVTDAGLKELARAETGLKALTTLDLSSTQVTDAGLKELARAETGLKALTTLHLRDTQVTDAGLRKLARAETGLKALTTLGLVGTKVTDAGLKELARAETGLKALTSLDLSGTKVTDVGLDPLTRADTGLKALTTLDLSYTQVTGAGLAQLARADTGLKALTTLNLGKLRVTDAGLAELARADTGLKALTTLQVYDTQVTDAGLAELARADTGLKALTTLGLNGTQVRDAGLAQLARANTGLKALTKLYLGGTQVTDAGLAQLARADTGLKALTALDLSFTQVTDAGLAQLARADTGLKALTALYFWGTQVTDEGIAKNKARFPGITILR